MSYVPVNWEIAKNPANWIIVTLMMLIALFAFSIIRDYLFPPSQN